jgi:hypothetical protein
MINIEQQLNYAGSLNFSRFSEDYRVKQFIKNKKAVLQFKIYI